MATHVILDFTGATVSNQPGPATQAGRSPMVAARRQRKARVSSRPAEAIGSGRR
jgi:hypothetical protein